MLQTQWLTNQEQPLRTGKLISEFCMLKAPVKRWDGSTWCGEERHVAPLLMHDAWMLRVVINTGYLKSVLSLKEGSFSPSSHIKTTREHHWLYFSSRTSQWQQQTGPSLCSALCCGCHRLRREGCHFQLIQTLSSPRWYHGLLMQNMRAQTSTPFIFTE